MHPRRVALALAVVGLLLVPAPVYLSAAGTALAPPPKSPTVYGAAPVDLGTPDGRATVLDHHATRTTLSLHRVSERYSAGEYRAPNRTRRVLRTAVREGNATASDPAVRADLRAVARNDTFLTEAYRAGESYARFRVRDGGRAVTARNVTDARVANVTAERHAVAYDDLSPAERRTVDRILESEEGWGSRPRADDPFADRLPALVRVDGTLYSLHGVAHVDDLGPGFTGFVYGVYAAGAGLLILVLAGALWVVGRRRG